ncbi:MAG: 16S rRNA (cytosine(1402)-N(4))-methyltransferase RsmH [Lachnospiraceae bacterium]
MSEELQKSHKRRVRYSGTHPKKFSEKYKEHQPEKYADTIEKVKSKGSTPAGMHISICVNEIIEFLDIKPGEKGLDVTLGYGGHSTEMLKCLKGEGHLYGLDIDPIEIVKTTKRLEERGFGADIFTSILTNFSEIDAVAKEHGPFDFVLADLGLSSMQIDNPERGFSYKTQGLLDMRLNPTKGISAAERLRDISISELEGMLVENADEPYAEEIAKAIVYHRKNGGKLETTTDLRAVIEKTLDFLPKQDKDKMIKKSCQRVFQAIRIDVNSEFEVLEALLEKLPDVLAPGGRIAILTFHSGEDRLVKKSFKEFKKMGLYEEVADDVIRPSAEECRMNGRASCTKMRWAKKA